LNYEPYKNGIIDIRFRTTKAVNILDENLIDDQYMVINKTPSKTMIKAAIESGEDVPGAEIAERRNVIIK